VVRSNPASVVRQAAKTAKGRVKIAWWLKFLENRTAQQDPGDLMADYDSHGYGKSSVCPICANDQFAAAEQPEGSPRQPAAPLTTRSPDPDCSGAYVVRGARAYGGGART
jgi:hypothetical protein